MRGIKLSQENLEGLVFFLNSIVFIGLGTTILRLCDVANIYVERIRVVTPDYVDYIASGYVVGYLLLFFAIIQMFFSAMKFIEAKSAKKVEIAIKSEVKGNAP